jgi:carbamate kinase
MKQVLIAVGGNALFDLEGGNNVDPIKLETVCNQIIETVTIGYQPIITFGNGPQVGTLLEMSESFAKPGHWPTPLDVCVAWTQAEIGYFMTKALHYQLRLRGLEKDIVAVNTTVFVDPADPAFLDPTKFVGHFYTEDQANQLRQERGWLIKQDSNRGFRRVVPSPRPLKILEETAIKSLIDNGCIVLCGGGGGIPVIEEQDMICGVEAVIDKDFTACLLASRLGIPEIVICTGVEKLALNFGQPDETPLDEVSIEDAKRYLAEGHFPPGSMGPKVQALIRYVEDGGQRATITTLEKLGEALQGESGTRLVPSFSTETTGIPSP